MKNKKIAMISLIIIILSLAFISIAALGVEQEMPISKEDTKLSISEIQHTPSSIKTGSKVTIKAYVQNNMDSAAKNVKVKFILLSDHRKAEGKGMMPLYLGKIEKEAELKGTIIGEKTISTIAPRKKSPASVTLTIPSGVDSVNVAAIAQDGQLVSNIPVQQLFTELSMTNLSASKKNPIVGETLSIKANVMNDGALTAKKVVVAFYASTDGKNYINIGNKTISSIFGKKSGQAMQSWKVPNSDKIYLRAEVNPSYNISEKNYSDNSMQIEIMTSLPDLALSGSSINITGDVAKGNKLKIKATVQNIGIADAKNTDISFYYASASGSQVLIGTKKTTISKGKGSIVEMQWTVPADISAKQAITVKANPNRAIAENDYSNNQGTFTASARMPDLIANIITYNATLSSNAQQSSGMRMTATVTNAGTDTANSIMARITYNGQVKKEEIIPSLAVNSPAYQFTYVYPLSYGTSPGSLEFKIIVDPLNTINEADDTNNEARSSAVASQNRPPVAAMTISKTNAMKGEYIDFSCIGSSDPDTPFGRPACTWFFDGVQDPFNEAEKSVYFTTSGQHNIKLIVTDQFMLTNEITKTVTIQPNVAPSIDAQGPFTAYKGEESTFSAACSDTDGSVASVNWNFGDGTTEAGGCDGVHTYQNTGSYTITATAVDDNGATATDTATVNVINAPAMLTKTYSEVYVAHYSNPQVASAGDGPDAEQFYGLYKVEYEVKYTQNDNVIRKIKYSIYSGPGIISQITDSDPDFYFIPLAAASGQGGTAMTVTRVAIQQGSTELWSMPTYSFLSPAESPLVREFAGLEIPVDWNNNYFTIQSTIEFPAQMCMWENYDCQQQTALWAMD
jgi:hypothetical protein